MSAQAIQWAIEQKTGGTSGKAALLTIANYANKDWCLWPSQKRIAVESEQSIDSIQRRFKDLGDAGLIRRIPMKSGGFRSVDFIVLKPSKYFDATLAEIAPILPRGFQIEPRFAAEAQENAAGSLTEDRNTTEHGQDAASLPQHAGGVTAMVREQEPSTELENLERDARARQEERVPNADLLEELMGQAVTAAYDLRSAVETAWRALSPERRQAAVERYGDWIAGAKKLGRTRPIGLPTYLRDGLWERLAPMTVEKAHGLSTAQAFSRAWWCVFVRYVDHNEQQIRHGSPVSTSIKLKIGAARRGFGWNLGSSEQLKVFPVSTYGPDLRL